MSEGAQESTSRVARIAAALAAASLTTAIIGILGVQIGALAPAAGFYLFLLGALLGGLLSLVLGAVIGVLYLMRRLFYSSSGQVDRGIIRTLASCYVAPKERIILVEVLGEKLLLGVTPHAINCLGKISDEREIEVSTQQVSSGFFRNLLRGAMDRRPGNTDMEADRRNR